MASQLLSELPAVFHQDQFLERFLFGFEKILLGIKDTVDLPAVGVSSPVCGLEETIDDIARYFDPARAPADFLPWLAG